MLKKIILLLSTGYAVLMLCSIPAQADDNSTHEKSIEMPLVDAVMLTIRNNRSIQNAYLERVVQKYRLRVAEDEFIPDIDVRAGVQRTESRNRDYELFDSKLTENKDTTINGSVVLSERIPTGADFTFTWAFNQIETDEGPTIIRRDERYSNNSWSVAVRQPLLRGAGISVATANLRQSRISEQQNILSLKSTLISTVTSVILSYRNFLRAGRQVDISRASLERSRANVEKNKLLIKAGRMAAMELVQAEADVARTEFAYQQALNSFDNARLSLINILDIDKNTMITPTDPVEIEQFNPDYDICIDVAYKNRPDYLTSLLSGESRDISLVVAKNNRLWDLDLNADYSYSESDSKLAMDSDAEQWSVGVDMQIPLFGDLTRKQNVVDAKVSLRQYEIDHRELQEDIAITIQDAIRDIKMKLIQVRLAQQARELSEKKLEVEQEKLNLGRTTNFQIVTFQNDLVSAQISELDAKIAYLNALTQLDRELGTTLDTWKVEFKTERAVEY